ncbi:MAG TPA: Crp/Fnr family transcriptional regulator [Gemmatimonadaceae bacterium]|jgi:CRP-like cAMP-binding protein|nr:Crp/Fnr family transcriptional regulator [Gemmatimonadaceae bacterium]
MKTKSGPLGHGGGDGISAPTVVQNNIIAKLPPNELASFEKRARRITSSLREILFDQNEPFERVLFPLTGMGSLVTVLKDGTTLEAMTVGHEGFMGLPLFHGITVARCKGITQVEGDFYEMSPEDFSSLISIAPELRVRLHRYAQFSTEVIAQSAACNSMHLIEQRCARWLLLTADAVARKDFSLTQEFLSQMLAVRRPGVTVAIGALERQGLIEHRYGKVSISDVEGLKKVSCECYQTISDKARELLD